MLDTDGCIFIGKGKLNAVYCTTSNGLAKQIKKFLVELRVACSLTKQSRKKRKDTYYIRISRLSVDKFLNIIKPYKAKKWADSRMV